MRLSTDCFVDVFMYWFIYSCVLFVLFMCLCSHCSIGVFVSRSLCSCVCVLTVLLRCLNLVDLLMCWYPNRSDNLFMIWPPVDVCVCVITVLLIFLWPFNVFVGVLIIQLNVFLFVFWPVCWSVYVWFNCFVGVFVPRSCHRSDWYLLWASYKKKTPLSS